jgi:hypothetical protein
VEIARAVLAYGKWRAAVTANEDASTANALATEDRQSAETKENEATAQEARAAEIEADVGDRAKALPSEKELEVLSRLERELEVAEAALGGGIRVTVRPRGAVSVRFVADQNDVMGEAGTNGERMVEAERRVHVSLDGVADVDVVAGRAEQRRAAEEARARWAADGAPVVVRAGAKSVAQIVTMRADVEKALVSAAELRRRAEKERLEARSLRERAALNQRAAAAISPKEVEERKAAIGSTSLGVPEKEFSKLGKPWELNAESEIARRDKRAQTAKGEAAELEKALALLDYQATEAEREAKAAAEVWQVASRGLEASDPMALLRVVDDDLATLSRNETALQAEIRALGAEATSEVEQASKAVEASRERLNAAREAQVAATAALDEAKAEWSARVGEHRALFAQLQAMNREGAAALVVERTRELDTLPSSPTVSESDVVAAENRLEQANRDLESAKEDLHKAEGALSKVGGEPVREEVTRVEEALAAARERERDLVIEADAWKLLRATLVEVEKKESGHLGRALAGPVTARFAELTGRRYGNLRLDQALKAEGVDVAGAATPGPDVLGALSVGTRNQLATIVRLTIADQLKAAIILDDHLVNTDPTRLEWFRDALRKTALNTQVIVLTCRPEDYLTGEELPTEAMRDLGGRSIRAINFEKVVKRWSLSSVAAPVAGVSSEATALKGAEVTDSA